jgi:hypothetical protein
MKGKILFVVGLGVGYVLGTRAGRERYEQIREAAQRVWNQPTVQDGVDTVKQFAMSRVGDLSDTVLDNAKQFVRSVSGTKSPAKTDATDATNAAQAAQTAVDQAAAKLDSASKRAAAAAETASKTTASAKQTASSSTAPASKPAPKRGPATSTDS